MNQELSAIISSRKKLRQLIAKEGYYRTETASGQKALIQENNYRKKTEKTYYSLTIGREHKVSNGTFDTIIKYLEEN